MLPFVSLLLHVYIAARLLPALPFFPIAFGLLTSALILSAMLMPMGIGFAPRYLAKHRMADIFIWSGWVGMGLFSSLFVLTVARDLVLLAFNLAGTFGTLTIDAESLRRYSALAVWLLGAGATMFGFANARRTAAIVPVDVPITGLPTALNGFRIVQISDIHVGPTIRHDYLQRIVTAVNQLHADMVAITGDLVDGTVQELAAHVAPLAGLKSQHGSYFVTGNHEYYSGAHAWIAELQRLGIKVLLNSHVVLQHSAPLSGSASLVVAGVTDYSAEHFDAAHRSDPTKAIAGAPADAGIKILLAHQPRSADAASDAGFDLQLSGHTHGGQFMPWNFFVRLQQPFVAGLDRMRGMWVYTSRGTGYWGPPKRFGAPSEITLLRLMPA